jgi:hypothetical protein
MRNLDMLLPQTLAQAKASSQRRPSVQTASQPELRNFSEIIGERTYSPDATEVNLELFGAKVLRQDGKLALRASGFKRIGH